MNISGQVGEGGIAARVSRALRAMFPDVRGVHIHLGIVCALTCKYYSYTSVLCRVARSSE